MFYSSALLPPALERSVQHFQQTFDPKRRYEHLLWSAKWLPELPAAAKIATSKAPSRICWIDQHMLLPRMRVLGQG